MSISVYLQSLINNLFKIIPMKEEELSGHKVYLQKYVESLAKEVSGACDTFPQLGRLADYISICNTLNYISKHEDEMTKRDIKSEIFKTIDNVSAVQKKLEVRTDA
jgi:hypothetical protein